jgi:membrane protease YdiL (CAAX protease family)
LLPTPYSLLLMNTLLNPLNHLFELARSGRRLPHGVLAVILSFVFVLAAQFVGGIPAILLIAALSMLGTGQNSFDKPEALLQLVMPDTALEMTILLVLSFAPIFLLLWAWLKWYEKRPFQTLGLEWRGAGRKYLGGLLVGLVMFAVSVGISAALGFIAFEEGASQRQGPAALGGVLLIFLGWTVQGPAEEILSRGWLLPVIGARHKPLAGILISSAVFAIYHSLNPNIDPVAFLNLFLFGLFTAFYVLYEGSLWGVFGLHAAWNWAQGNLFGLEVSGMPAAGGTLFNLMEVGPDLITGGPFGPEGGLAVTLVLIVSSSIIWLLSERQGLKIMDSG